MNSISIVSLETESALKKSASKALTEFEGAGCVAEVPLVETLFYNNHGRKKIGDEPL